MATEKQVTKMVAGDGFEYVEEQGFHSFTRRHPDDERRQWLRFIFWGNPKHADKAGIPRSYLCVIPSLDVEVEGHDPVRLRLPLVYWPDDEVWRVPAAEQTIRPWGDVTAEFHRVFMTAFDAPYDEGSATLKALPGRYHLTWRT